MAEAKVVNVHFEEIMDTALFDIVILIISILIVLTTEDTEGNVGIMIMPHDDLVSVHGLGTDTANEFSFKAVLMLEDTNKFVSAHYCLP